MARLNTKKIPTKMEELTVNYEGAEAYKLPVKMRLVERVVGAFWSEDLFYATGKEISGEILKDIQEVAKSDPKFILQLAVFARNELYLRTTPQVLLVEASYIAECKPFVEEYTSKIVRRADELTEVVAYHISRMGSKKNFANSLKRGLANAFQSFDEYQLNKYKGNTSSVSLGDVVKIVHPTFKGDEEYRKALYAYLTKGEVSPVLTKVSALKTLLSRESFDDEAKSLINQSAATWESVVSKFGSTKEVWEAMIPKMGYMALLRNLRNFEEKNVQLNSVIERLTNEEEVKRSKQLPFRFYAAHQEVKTPQLKKAVSKAFELSINNTVLGGSTAVLVDLSGSMYGHTVSKGSKMLYTDVAAVMGAIAVKKSEYPVVIAFANSATRVDVDPDDTMMTTMKNILNCGEGGGTYAYKAFENLLQNKHIKFDRVVMFSDMQCYTEKNYDGNDVSKLWKEYVNTVNKDAVLYSFDLSGYGTSKFNSKSKNVVTVAGWSDKILDFINLHEKDKNLLLNEIAKM
jgi:hypothetical protein